MKKQIMSIVLAVSMLASLFTAFMLPVVAVDDPTERAIFVTDNAIVIDGKLDEDYLESDKIVSIYSIRDKDPNLSFEGYAVATKDGINIWLEIKGETTYVNEEGRNVNDYKGQGENRDYLQVYYNMSASASQTDHIGYVMHDYYNSTYFRNEAGSNKIGYGTTPPEGFQSAAVKTDKGWISEMFIAWPEGSPVKAGMDNSDLSTYFGLGFQYNDDTNGDDKYNTAVYDKNTTSYWSNYGLTCPSKFIRSFGRLSKTNVFLDGNFAIDYNVSLGSEYPPEKMAVRYTIKGVDGTYTNTVRGKMVDPVKDTYNFKFILSPSRMNDTILVELLKDGKVIQTRDEYTVRDFCISTLNSSFEDLGLTENQYVAALNAASGLLNFGAMAQKIMGYDVANLANKGYESDFADLEMVYDEIVVSDKAAGYNNIDLVSYNMYFDGESRFCFKVKADQSVINNVVLSVYEGGGKPATYYDVNDAYYDSVNDVYEFYSDPIDPTDYDFNYIVRLEYIEDLGTEWESYKIVQSVKSSVNAYLAQIVETSTNDDMVTLAKAAYAIGVSIDALSKS